MESGDDLRRLIADTTAAGNAEARRAAVAAVPPSLVANLLHVGVAEGPRPEALGTGVAASPGAASGTLCLTTEAVLDASDLSLIHI